MPSAEDLKPIRFSPRSVHNLCELIPYLFQGCQSARLLREKSSKFIWSGKKNFPPFKTRKSNSTENTQSNPTMETRIKSDTSCASLGAAL